MVGVPGEQQKFQRKVPIAWRGDVVEPRDLSITVLYGAFPLAPTRKRILARDTCTNGNDQREMFAPVLRGEQLRPWCSCWRSTHRALTRMP
jgi:hypothetical protein